MPSLRELRPLFPAVVIDAASAVVQVGVLNPGGADVWQTSDEESGIAIFRSLERLPGNAAGCPTLIYCQGPGSILGVRTAAMALRTLEVLSPRRFFAYSSLALVAHALGRADVSVIADARRESWHCFQLGHGLRRLGTAELKGELVTPEGFRNWTPLPENTQRVPYVLAALFGQAAGADLFHAVESPDAFLHEEPSYVTWTPQIHRAPDAVSRSAAKP